MPTYRLKCRHCHGEFELWCSIHDKLPTTHDVSLDPLSDRRCAGALVQVFTRVATYGVGSHGTHTLTADARERRLDLDRPAYKRLRMEGHQPQSMTGSHELEAKATDDWYIKTGGLVSVPDDKRAEVSERLADASTSGWSPVEQVHHERSQ